MYSSNFLNSNDFKTIVVKLNYMLINFELANQRAPKLLFTKISMLLKITQNLKLNSCGKNHSRYLLYCTQDHRNFPNKSCAVTVPDRCVTCFCAYDPLCASKKQL